MGRAPQGSRLEDESEKTQAATAAAGELREILEALRRFRVRIQAMRRDRGDEFVRDIMLEDVIDLMEAGRLFSPRPLAHGSEDELKTLEQRLLIALMPISRKKQAAMAGLKPRMWRYFIKAIQEVAELPPDVERKEN